MSTAIDRVLDLPWMLAQSAPPLSNQPVTTAQPGSAANGSTGTGPVPAPSQSPFPMVLLIGVMGAIILFSVLGNRRETKRKQSMLEALKKNDRVQTVGGIIGSIIEIKPEVVVLRVDENSNTRVTFARSAVVGIVKEAAAEATKPS